MRSHFVKGVELELSGLRERAIDGLKQFKLSLLLL